MAISSIQGLASGIQWQDMIDQLMQVDTTNQVTPLTNRITANDSKKTALTSISTAMSTLRATAASLADGSAFTSLTANVPASPTTSRTLLTATTSSTAVPGSYGIEVLDTAAAQQLSGNIVSSATTALGLSGQFMVAGKVVTLAAPDSLNAVRDKINALNTGATPTRISASILYAGGTAARLVLSSDTGGAAGLDLRDVRASSADASMLTQLGLIDGKAVRVGADGAVRSASFSSATLKVSALATGVTSLPAATTISVNGRSVAVDLQNNSLTDIAAAINAQSANSASVETVTSGATTSYRLKISGAVAATSDVGSQPALDLLGVTRGTTGVVKQQVSTSNVLQDGASATATGASTLLGLKIAGGVGAQLGDTFTITGRKADGVTAVSLTQTVDGSKTVADMLSDISAAFSAPGRTVSAALVGGKIQLTDDAGGDSGLSFSIAANNESGVADPVAGANLSFGATTVDATGRLRELAQGRDARIVVNGVQMTRDSNTISDAITGVTLTVNQAEAGTTIPVTIARDTDKAVSAVQSLATAYNALQSVVSSQTAAGGALAYNASVRASLSSVKNALLANVSGLASGSVYNNAALVGVTLDKTGQLNVDTTALTSALASNADAVKAVFQQNGTVTGASLSYLAASSATVPGAYDVTITRAATVPTVASTAANFVYADGGTADTMTITDSATGQTGNISLVSGDTPDSVAGKLNALFTAQGYSMSASNVGGALTISGLTYGSVPSFTVAYTATDGTDVAGQLGIAAAKVQNGLDVQGKFTSAGIDYAATGSGQTLTGATGTPVDGLAMLYTGSADSSTGHVDFVLGVAGQITRLADSVTQLDGTIALQTAALDDSTLLLTQRQADVMQRLTVKRQALTTQFTAMETALSKIQAQGNWLTQQVNAMNGLQSTSK